MDEVRKIADAVLYEGYILWPYRRSALKNTHRFMFGTLEPHGRMRTEVLLDGAQIDITVRFLQTVRRRLYDDGRPVAELIVDGERHLSWDEATEREISASGAGLYPIAIGAGQAEEQLSPEAAVVRSWDASQGEVSVDAERLRPGRVRVSVEIVNTGPSDFLSTHTILHARDGAFVSSLDPEAQELCRNEGTWPVLVGEPGDRRTMLSSPIILEEYPRVAPESPGDLFDGAEIDQLLRLNILSLTDEEKAEMRATDPRARAILDRTEALSAEELTRLHGVIRP
jgi:hypothetical protein